MAIQSTQVPIYTYTHYFCIFLIFQILFLFLWKTNKAKTENNYNKNMKETHKA